MLKRIITAFYDTVDGVTGYYFDLEVHDTDLESESIVGGELNIGFCPTDADFDSKVKELESKYNAVYDKQGGNINE